MRQVTRKGLMTMAAATGVLAAAGGAAAHADSGATGGAKGSPGVLSGNVVQAPVHVPVNVCGNTVNVVGVLNPAVGNACANKGGSGHHGGAHAHGTASDSPGVASGNAVQAPVHVPVNVCGNSVDVIGVGNGRPATTAPTRGTTGSPGEPGEPGEPGNPGSRESPVSPVSRGTLESPATRGAR